MKNKDLQPCMSIIASMSNEKMEIEDAMNILDLVDELSKELDKINKLSEKHKFTEDESKLIQNEQAIINKYQAMQNPDSKKLNEEILHNHSNFDAQLIESLKEKISEIEKIQNTKCRKKFGKIKLPAGIKVTLSDLSLLRDCELLTK